jgi:thymidylate synthase (FAD)
MRQIDKSSAIQRTTVPALEEILGWAYPVLDHGFIRVIDYMGDDQAIDEAARTSYGAGTKRVNAAQGLINTLMRDRHTSPFEMCEIKLHIKMPIFVMRQWVRHRTASLNEYSARYSVLKDEFYVPQIEDMMHQSSANKQGRAGVLPEGQAFDVQNQMVASNAATYALYEMLLENDDPEDYNLTRELARTVLPVSAYTEVYWKINLHNLLHFLMLRNDSHAQKEIRDYAEIIQTLISDWVPMTVAAFINYRQNAISFSGVEQALISRALVAHTEGYLHRDEPAAWAEALSKREWDSFVTKIRKIADGS